MTFEASLRGADHYAVLGVARGAEKLTIKQAYFALASEFHPDRHFGKALGAAGPALQRVFVRLTQAYDALANRARRAEYDATLPPLPSPPPVAPPQAPRRRSTATRIAVAVADTIPAPPAVSPTVARTPAVTVTMPAPSLSSPVLRASSVSAAASATAPPSSGGRARTDEALYRFYQSAQRKESARRVAVFRDIAEAALARHDLVVAAQHFRLVLENHDDPIVRAKLAAIEEAVANSAQNRSKQGR